MTQCQRGVIGGDVALDCILSKAVHYILSTMGILYKGITDYSVLLILETLICVNAKVFVSL